MGLALFASLGLVGLARATVNERVTNVFSVGGRGIAIVRYIFGSCTGSVITLAGHTDELKSVPRRVSRNDLLSKRAGDHVVVEAVVQALCVLLM